MFEQGPWTFMQRNSYRCYCLPIYFTPALGCHHPPIWSIHPLNGEHPSFPLVPPHFPPFFPPSPASHTNSNIVVSVRFFCPSRLPRPEFCVLQVSELRRITINCYLAELIFNAHFLHTGCWISKTRHFEAFVSFSGFSSVVCFLWWDLLILCFFSRGVSRVNYSV